MSAMADDQPPEEPPARPDPLLGQTLVERYQLTRKIGEGGMGAVYEARHVGLDKPMAVKVLRDKYLDRPNVAQRLVQEARLASAIRHQHIIDITDSGTTSDGRTFVVMELLDGESLGELLRREGALPEARAIRIAQQVAGALGAAHARGIVHRDVKPENVFLVKGQNDFVKVVDFGISTTVRDAREDAAEGPGRLTSTGMVLGTPFYMSPEQGRGDDQIDHRIDVYALGVILYECLTGEVPFRGGNYLGIISRVLNHEATRPRALRPELRISEQVERVTLKAMAKSRDERYPSMEAFAADLERVLLGEGVEAPPPPELPSAAAGAASRAWIFAAAAMVTLGAGALIWAGRAGRSVSPPTSHSAPATASGSTSTSASAPAPPSQVVITVETTPPGAEVRQGDRVFGLAPRTLSLPRASSPVHLTFDLEGYETAGADVVPLADDTLTVRLVPRPPKARPKKTHSDPVPPTPKPNAEIPPNPY
jgi:serine/threonine-protein kinase